MADTQHLGLTKIDDGNTNWGSIERADLDAIDKGMCPDNIFWVSPGFTPTALGNASAADRRHFPTIQEAVTAAQGGDYRARGTVEIYPGRYYENLVISGSVHITGRHRANMSALGGGRSVEIVGNGTVQSQLVTINPTGDGDSVNFSNICFENVYNQATGAQIDKAYLIDVTKPVSYTQRIWLGFSGCQARMQTQGDHNLWRAGIAADGWVDINIDDMQIYAGKYAGGGDDGGIRRIFDLNGDESGGHYLNFQAHQLKIAQSFGGPMPLPASVYANNGVLGQVHDSKFPDDALIFANGGVGTNQIEGLHGTTIQEYGNNLLGNQAVFF